MPPRAETSNDSAADHAGWAPEEGGLEFTDAHVEVLVLFASQAGAAIANAGVYRDGHRARANLEALLDTLPIGVAVFDAMGRRAGSSRSW